MKTTKQYIDNAAPFARFILKHLTELIRKTCPNVEETIKWGHPHFGYEGMMCSIASFKKHCVFTFWKGAIMKDPYMVMEVSRSSGMGQFCRIEKSKDLPSDEIIVEYVQEAMQLNEEGVKVPKKPGLEKNGLVVPESLLTALKKKPMAFQIFNDFSQTKKRDYAEWISEAKRDSTREKRVIQSVEWISEGKGRNWKYE